MPTLGPDSVSSTAPVGAQGRREPRVYDADRAEVFITMRCPRCRKSKPLRDFGLRRMADGRIRNQPQCVKCRAKGVATP